MSAWTVCPKYMIAAASMAEETRSIFETSTHQRRSEWSEHTQDMDELARALDTARAQGALLSRPSAVFDGPLRLRGGGGDGGSTGAESRSAYLEMYKEKDVEAVDPAQQRHAKWTRCSFSGEPLSAPIVADEAGALFNKAALLEGLAQRAAGGAWPDSLAHIRRMRDLITVNAKWSAEYKEEDAAGGDAGPRPGAAAPLECPVLGIALSGRVRTLLHRPSGCLLSERGLRELPEVACEALGLPARPEATGATGRATEEPEGRAKGQQKWAWNMEEFLVIHPEGEDAEKAKDRADALKRKAKKKKRVADESEPETKRATFSVAPRAGGAVLASLFHEDGGGARVQETFCCRSVGARGMNLS